MLNILYERKWQPDSETTLLQAFRTIDTDAKGFVGVEELRELLTVSAVLRRSQSKERPYRGL
eukprot:scaffold774_cov248-Pinguiococcus_pyrenoidosus.AAC.9